MVDFVARQLQTKQEKTRERSGTSTPLSPAHVLRCVGCTVVRHNRSSTLVRHHSPLPKKTDPTAGGESSAGENDTHISQRRPRWDGSLRVGMDKVVGRCGCGVPSVMKHTSGEDCAWCAQPSCSSMTLERSRRWTGRSTRIPTRPVRRWQRKQRAGRVHAGAAR